jgi:molybdenum cofactor cytidylyltransferase
MKDLKPQNIAAVILAAGLSRRMGTPKMLLPWGQTTVLGQVIATFAQAGVSDTVVVTGGARQAVEAEAERLAQTFRLRFVHNPQSESGEMLSSLQCGLATLDLQAEAALVGLGDQPQLSLASVLSVVSVYESSVGRLIVPSYNLRRGHPWLVQRDFWEQILALKPPLTLRDFLNAHAVDIIYVEADQTILKDLDTPDDYLREKP